MIIHGLKTCDTCRAAVKATGGTLRDVRTEPLTTAELARFLDAFGDELVNRRSTTWRGLDEATRAGEAATLLAAHPALMKRPVIETPEGALHLGWTPAVRTALGH